MGARSGTGIVGANGPVGICSESESIISTGLSLSPSRSVVFVECDAMLLTAVSLNWRRARALFSRL